jgi:hypothetical protein
MVVDVGKGESGVDEIPFKVEMSSRVGLRLQESSATPFPLRAYCGQELWNAPIPATPEQQSSGQPTALMAETDVLMA